MEEQHWPAADVNTESVDEAKRVQKAMIGKEVIPEMD